MMDGFSRLFVSLKERICNTRVCTRYPINLKAHDGSIFILTSFHGQTTDQSKKQPINIVLAREAFFVIVCEP